MSINSLSCHNLQPQPFTGTSQGPAPRETSRMKQILKQWREGASETFISKQESYAHSFSKLQDFLASTKANLESKLQTLRISCAFTCLGGSLSGAAFTVLLALSLVHGVAFGWIGFAGIAAAVLIGTFYGCNEEEELTNIELDKVKFLERCMARMDQTGLKNDVIHLLHYAIEQISPDAEKEGPSPEELYALAYYYEHKNKTGLCKLCQKNPIE